MLSLVTLIASHVIAGMQDAAFVVGNASDFGYSTVNAPSVNSNGDLVIEGLRTDGFQGYTAFIYSGTGGASPYTSQLLRLGDALSPFPAISDDRAGAIDKPSVAGFGTLAGGLVVAAPDTAQPFALQNEFQVIQRFDYDPALRTFKPPAMIIAYQDANGPSPGRPFSHLDQTVAIDRKGGVTYFEGSIPGVQHGVFKAATTLSTVLAAENAKVADLSDLVDVDGANGSVVFYGTINNESGVFETNGSGIYRPVATASNGFAATGTRPTINSAGVVAFYGDNNGQFGVYVQSPQEPTPRLVSKGFLATFDGKVAINSFNQVAYVGIDPHGRTGIFSTNLGSTREVIAEGDELIRGDPTSQVQSLQLYNGLMDSGQIAFAAQTPAGASIVRMNRAYTQTVLNDSPVAVPWSGTRYLLRSLAPAEIPSYYHLNGRAKTTIGALGCDLTATADLLSFYGVNVTPGDLQNWILAQWAAAPTKDQKLQLIGPQNDFFDNIVDKYTASVHGNQVHFVREFDNTLGTSNRTELIEELQGGRAVKLRVPDGTDPWGHNILAYGLRNPNAGTVTDGDVLIHDPGHGGIYTLDDYEHSANAGAYIAGHPNWLEEHDAGNRRLYLFAATPANAVFASVYSPVSLLITDPQGRQLGMGATAGVGQIPGGDYWQERSYDSLDDGAGPTEKVWESDGAVERFILSDAAPGKYTFHLTGTGDGSFDVSLDGSGLLRPDIALLSGTITAGQQLDFDVNISFVPEPVVALLACAGVVSLRRRSRVSNVMKRGVVSTE